MDIDQQRSGYLAASSAVRRRIIGIRLASGIRRSHLVVGAIAFSLTLGFRLFAHWREDEWMIVGGVFFLWLVILGLFAAIRLPKTGGALLLLDRKGAWKDRFSSAWEFLNLPSRTEAQTLHLEKSAVLIDKAVGSIPPVFPLPSLKWAWLPPLIAMVFALSPWMRIPPDSRDLELTDGMKDAAVMQAEELRREAKRVGEFGEMTEDEKKALIALGVDVESAADKLANPDGLTAGEMLETLDAQAGAAERLAKNLERYADEWASSQMLEEMARHPDTADLSLLIADKAAMPAADEAMRLKEVFDDTEIKRDTEERLTRSLEAIMKAALELDLTRPVGERFGNASAKMQNAQTKTAAREFEELSKHFREMAGREETIRELEQLAESLREAGGEISGSELQKMEQIAEAAGSSKSESNQGLRPLDSDSGGSAKPGEMPGLAMPNPAEGGKSAPSLAAAPSDQKSGEKKSPAPGLSNGKNEAGEKDGQGQESFSAPVPGEEPKDGKSGSGLGMSDTSREGEGSGGMLSAPVPGTEPGDASPGAGMSAAAGASSQSGQGGDQAGSGTAELVDDASEAIKATEDAKVVAQANQSGDSVLRSVEGQARSEKSDRSLQEVITDFIAVEEEALDEQSLPMSRKQHVLRYFSGIRQQFEDSSTE